MLKWRKLKQTPRSRKIKGIQDRTAKRDGRRAIDGYRRITGIESGNKRNSEAKKKGRKKECT
jgi:hypothetical protein